MMTLMQEPSIIYLAINLPQAEARRKSLMEQAQRLELPLQLVTALSGKDLTENELKCYDAKAHNRRYSFEMMPNQKACVLSHRKALKTFLDSAADYAVVLEDDALLADNFKEGIHELTCRLQGWECAKLYTDSGKLIPLLPQVTEDAPVQPIFPKKLLWVAVGYLYTRAAAEKLYASLGHFWRGADAQIGMTLLKEGIPTIGVTPSLVRTSDPDNLTSTIDTDHTRTQRKGGRSLLQFICYRLHVWNVAIGKWRMRRMMQRRLSRR